MKIAALLLTVILCTGAATLVRAAEFDAAKDFMCGDQQSENWQYLAYRPSDGRFRDLTFGRAPIAEVSKYGADAFYLPDGGQEYRPFFVRFGEDKLYCSPAFEGDRYDAALVWVATSGGNAVITGDAVLVGRIGAEPGPGKVVVRLLKGKDELWSAEVDSSAIKEFRLETTVAEGDRVCLRVENSDGDGPKITAVNMRLTVD